MTYSMIQYPFKGKRKTKREECPLRARDDCEDETGIRIWTHIGSVPI